MDTLADLLSHRLPELLRLTQGSDIRELDIRDDGWRVRIQRNLTSAVDGDVEATQTVSDFEPVETPVACITSPSVGTFYRAGEVGAAPLVAQGSRVEAHTVVGILEALHNLTDIEAGCDGVITVVLATDGQPVEYGQVLFEVDVNG